MRTAQVRDAWHLYRCSYGTPTTMFGREPVYAQNTSHVRSLELAHHKGGYYPTVGGFIGSKRNCPHGIGGRTCQDDGDDCSLHNYGIAWDVEYNFNRLSPEFRSGNPVPLSPEQVFLRDADLHKYTPEMVAKIEAVTNTHGEQLFRWLGWIGDYMHWQINVVPERQDVDWSSITGGDEEMTYISWANGMFDFVSNEEIGELYDAGYIVGETKPKAVAYWVAIRDLGSEGRSSDQRLEVARFIQTSTVSGWLAAAN